MTDRLQSLKNAHKPLFYPKDGIVTREKKERSMMNLLKLICPVKEDYYKICQ